MKLLTGDVHMEWMGASQQLGQILAETAQADDIGAAREKFAALSKELTLAVVQFGAPAETLYQFKCPMAMDNRGATWLQLDDSTRNPYFGAAMLQCGEVQQVLHFAQADGSDDE